MKRAASWNCRGNGFCDVIVPNPVLVGVVSGLFRLVVLSVLYDSSRNCSRVRDAQLDVLHDAQVEHHVARATHLCQPQGRRPDVGHQLLRRRPFERVDVEPTRDVPIAARQGDVGLGHPRPEQIVAEAERRAALLLQQERHLPAAEQRVDNVPQFLPQCRSCPNGSSTMPLVTNMCVRSNAPMTRCSSASNALRYSASVMVFDQVYPSCSVTPSAMRRSRRACTDLVVRCAVGLERGDAGELRVRPQQL